MQTIMIFIFSFCILLIPFFVFMPFIVKTWNQSETLDGIKNDIDEICGNNVNRKGKGKVTLTVEVEFEDGEPNMESLEFHKQA